MAKNSGIDIKFDIKLDSRAIRYFQKTAPERLQTAKRRAVEAAGIVWADEAKEITTNENHIDTGLYVNSIGYSTGSPSSPYQETIENGSKTTLKIGANVEYAGHLERRYGIFARAIDLGQSRMNKVAQTQVKNTLGL
jgi:Bacteriophage HK97-gp10, putative tail-component